MKACFLLQRRFAYVGHAMALVLQKKYGIEEFCGYVYLRSSLDFLNSQNDIKYTKLLLDDDLHKQYKNEKIDLEYLKSLEKEYGIPNLWPYIELDRIVRHGMFLREYPYNTPPYSHEEMIKILQVKAKAIIQFLEEEKPDFIIFSAIAGIGSLLLYHIAKKKNIKTFIIQTARVENRYTVSENYGGLSYVEETFKKIEENDSPYAQYIQEAEKFLKEFRDKPTPPSITDSVTYRPVNRARQFRFLKPSRLLKSIKWTLKVCLDYIKNKNRDDYEIIKPWHYLLDKTKRKIRVLIGYDDLYDRVDTEENFAFFPLQLEPEIASMLFAPFFSDQLWLIKQISRSLPLNYKLYIKEHPAMFGFRPHSFYKELKKIPNVKIIRPDQPSFSLIENSKIIFTTTGTAAWEGILMKKPAITFGNAFFNILPIVKRCKAIEELPYLIREQLENFHYNEKSVINCIAALLKESIGVDLVTLWDIEGGGQMEKKERELSPLVELIIEKLSMNSNNTQSNPISSIMKNSMETKKKAFITGITGQDGSYLADLLLSKGYEVHGLVRSASSFNRGRIEHIYMNGPIKRDEKFLDSDEEIQSATNLILHYGDLTDASNLYRLIEKINPDEIYNLGAQSHVRISFDIPEYTANVVALGTLRLLDAIRETRVKTKFYQASSSEMFGNAAENPQNENTPFKPRSPYGISKVFAYWIARNYREAYGMHVSNGILFNHESPRRTPNFVTRKITTGIAEILSEKRAKIYLGNLEAKRDWGYAPDYVEAMWLMLQQDQSDDYVIATGETHSVKEFIEEAFKLVGIDNWQDYIGHDPQFERPTEINVLCGDATKAKEKLGWQPKVKFKELVKILLTEDCKKLGISI